MLELMPWVRARKAVVELDLGQSLQKEEGEDGGARVQ
jgi:hypothetical protein